MTIIPQRAYYCSREIKISGGCVPGSIRPYILTTFSDLQSGQIECLPVLLYTFPQSSHRYLYHRISSTSIFIGPTGEHMRLHPFVWSPLR